MYVTAIVLAAGKGARLKNRISKPLVVLNSKPVIVYSLETFDRLPFIRDIIVAVNAANRAQIVKTIRRFGIRKVRRVVIGGGRRQDSLGKGLANIDPRTDVVLIHDAARPFTDKKSIAAAVKTAFTCGAAVVGVPVKATIKAVHRKNFVKKTLDRKQLWEIQTPQVFKKELIVKAFEKFGGTDVTDDAMLVEKLGARVCVVPGSYKNIKITTPEDLVIAEAICKR